MSRAIQKPKWAAVVTAVIVGAACVGRSLGSDVSPAVEPSNEMVPILPVAPSATAIPVKEPILPPRSAMLAGLLPLSSLGVDTFRLNHPTYDGRGVVIGILDSGVDAGVPGLAETSIGQAKILDLRDFSGEGRVPLEQISQPSSDTLAIGGRLLSGFGRVARLSRGPYYVGVFRELPLGRGRAADVNGNGTNTDTFPLVVAKSSSGWFVVTDSDGDASFANENPVRDYAVGRETFVFRSGPGSAVTGPMTLAVNLTEERRRPVLDLYFDNSSHGTHVAGIAAGHNMFDVAGFDGVAPGAQILGLKIANNARGGITVTGSILRAMNYAADYAQQRSLPLVLNLSFGVGNEYEGAAAIDSLVDEFALKHPEVLYVISAGNDGPGLSTAGFPGSSERALSVCALLPGVYAKLPRPGEELAPDVIAWWSARGGEVTKPDVCAPGIAFSNVPRWNTGEEIQPGTSFAAPQVAGAAALLQSALAERGRRARSVDLTRALMNTAGRPAGATVLDVGAGVPNVEAAYRWLMASHQAGVYSVRALSDDGSQSTFTGAYRRLGLASSADTIQRFVVNSVGGQPAARFVLHSDTDWLRAPPILEPAGEPDTITLTYDAATFSQPGVYVGTVWAVPATDTMAGPSFGLVNTVVVPRSLATPFETESELSAGGTDRYFFTVPEGVGGLEVRLFVTAPTNGTTLHLFEPSGQPNRDRSNVSAGGDEPATVNLSVSAEDLIPGVYEAVVTAPPADGVSYRLAAALPQLYVTSVGDGPAATVRNTGAATTATVSAAVVGATMVQRVGGSGSDPHIIRVTQPDWAERLVLDVSVPKAYWNLVTDFGVTVFDSTGAKLADGPIDYAFARQSIGLDSLGYDGDLLVELFPAYAHADPATSWAGDLRVSFMLGESLELATATDSSGAERRIGWGDDETFRFSPVPVEFSVPSGFEVLVEVTARPESGPRALRRGVVRKENTVLPLMGHS